MVPFTILFFSVSFVVFREDWSIVGVHVYCLSIIMVLSRCSVNKSETTVPINVNENFNAISMVIVVSGLVLPIEYRIAVMINPQIPPIVKRVSLYIVSFRI